MKLLTLVPDTTMLMKLLGNYWYYVFVSFLLYTCRGFRSFPVFLNYQNPWLFCRLELVLISHCLQLYWEYCLLNFSLSFSSLSQYYSVPSTNIYFLLVEEIWLHYKWLGKYKKVGTLSCIKKRDVNLHINLLERSLRHWIRGGNSCRIE